MTIRTRTPAQVAKSKRVRTRYEALNADMTLYTGVRGHRAGKPQPVVPVGVTPDGFRVVVISRDPSRRWLNLIVVDAMERRFWLGWELAGERFAQRIGLKEFELVHGLNHVASLIRFLREKAPHAAVPDR